MALVRRLQLTVLRRSSRHSHCSVTRSVALRLGRPGVENPMLPTAGAKARLRSGPGRAPNPLPARAPTRETPYAGTETCARKR